MNSVTHDTSVPEMPILNAVLPQLCNIILIIKLLSLKFIKKNNIPISSYYTYYIGR